MGYEKCPKCKRTRNTEISPICPICFYGKPNHRKIAKTKIKKEHFNFETYKLPEIPLEQWIEENKKYFTKSRRQEHIHNKIRLVRDLKDYYHLSFPAIGRIMGNKDHTSALNLYTKYVRGKRID